MAGLCLLFATVARGQMPAALSVRVEKIDGGGGGSSGEALYELSAIAGGGGASFGFEYQLPPWPTPKLVSGSPIKIISVGLNGGGTIRPAASPLVPNPSLHRERICRREGVSPFATAYWVEMPANSTARIELRGRGTYPRWPGTRYDLRFSTFEVDDPAAVRSPFETASISGIGAKGTHIFISSVQPKDARDGRMTPEFIGRTDPALRSSHIFLRAVRPMPSGSVSLTQWAGSSPESVSLGRVSTNRKGQFRLPPQRFPLKGRYAVLARSDARGDLVADWNCGPFFKSDRKVTEATQGSARLRSTR